MKNIIKKLVILFIVLNLILSPTIAKNKSKSIDKTLEDPVVAQEVSINPVVKRIGGKNRILTSIKLSEESFENSDWVILVGYNGEIDALGGSLLAGKLNAPIIMTNKDKLSQEVKVELERLQAKNIIILGGIESISEDVVDSLGAYSVERVHGKDRLETSINIAKRTVGDRADEVFLSLGYDVYADALAIGPVTADLERPLFLTGRNNISPKTLKAMKDLKVKDVTIIGGPKVVSLETEKLLGDRGLRVKRIYGDNREGTAIKIAENYFKDPTRIIMANGYDFADSVIGGYYASSQNAPIILTRKDRLSLSNNRYISKINRDVTILGLQGSVGKRAETDLNILLKTDSFKDRFFLLPEKDSYDKKEAEKMIDRVMNIDNIVLSNIYYGGVRFKLCDCIITDEIEYSEFKGKVPRGWEGSGKTWDDIPGAGGSITPIARIGFSDPSDENGHNTINLELHELAHTIDNFITGVYNGSQISDSRKFVRAWEEEVYNILPYKYYTDYKEEYFAESFAMYYLNEKSKAKLKQKAPKTYEFIKDMGRIYY